MHARRSNCESRAPLAWPIDDDTNLQRPGLSTSGGSFAASGGKRVVRGGGLTVRGTAMSISTRTLYLMPFALMISFATAKAGVAAPCLVRGAVRGQDSVRWLRRDGQRVESYQRDGQRNRGNPSIVLPRARVVLERRRGCEKKPSGFDEGVMALAAARRWQGGGKAVARRWQGGGKAARRQGKAGAVGVLCPERRFRGRLGLTEAPIVTRPRTGRATMVGL